MPLFIQSSLANLTPMCIHGSMAWIKFSVFGLLACYFGCQVKYGIPIILIRIVVTIFRQNTRKILLPINPLSVLWRLQICIGLVSIDLF